jgi:hypothetical protein
MSYNSEWMKYTPKIELINTQIYMARMHGHIAYPGAEDSVGEGMATPPRIPTSNRPLLPAVCHG